MISNRFEVYGLVLAMLYGVALAESDCAMTLVSLSPCLNYVTGNSATPSPTCCSQLANVVQSQPECLCVFTGNGDGALDGLNINHTLALALPGACKVKTPPASLCNDGENGHTSLTPAQSPLGSGASIAPGTSPFTSNGATKKNLPCYVTFVVLIVAIFSS